MDRGSRNPRFALSPNLYPEYASPVANDRSVELETPSGFVLREAWLELDDTSFGRHTEHALVAAGRALPGACSMTLEPSSTRLTFDVPLFRLGNNGFRVHGVIANGQDERAVATPMHVVRYELPERFGLLAPGIMRLPALAFPMRASACPPGSCKDADGDGLSDLWENVASSELRPVLRMDAGDDLFRPREKPDVLRVLTSVVPRTRAGIEYVLFAYVVVFSRDYGFLGFDHPGDTEAFAMLFRVEDEATLRWIGSVAKGHACLTCGPKYEWNVQEYTRDGVPLVFVEQDKHGLWPNGHRCQTQAPFLCRGDRSMRPPATNVGDWTHEGPRALVDALDGLSLDGPFAELAGLFPGEAVWSPARARVAGRFCGGVAHGCTRKRSANQPGAVIGSLVRLVERAGW